MPTHFLHTFEELFAQPRCSDWGTKLQTLCEQVWNHVEGLDLGSYISNSLISLLQQTDALALAQLVAPDLRDDVRSCGVTGLKQHIMLHLEIFRSNIANAQNHKLSDFDVKKSYLPKRKTNCSTGRHGAGRRIVV